MAIRKYKWEPCCTNRLDSRNKMDNSILPSVTWDIPTIYGIKHRASSCEIERHIIVE